MSVFYKLIFLKKCFLLSGLMLGGLFLSSCEYEQWEEVDVSDLPEVISFEEHIIPIFDASCNSTSCHGGKYSPDLSPGNAYFDLTSGSYFTVDDPENSSFYVKIKSGSMTKYANDLDRALILKWIEQGTAEN